MSSVVVCDNGTGYLKAGMAGEALPSVHIPCLVGRPAVSGQSRIERSELPSVVAGQECLLHQSQLKVTSPIANGVIQNWDDMALLWRHVFTDHLKLVQIDPTESRILLTETPMNPRSHRERLFETMFETFNFQGVYLQVQAVLSLYSEGLMTGVVVDSGDGVTHVVPVMDGQSHPAHVKRLNVAGRHVTEYLAELLRRRGYMLNGVGQLEGVRELKHRACFVAKDYRRELQVARDTTFLVSEYTLPDGQVIKLGQERFQAAEVLFQPTLMGVETHGISEVVHACIHDLPIDERLGMYKAVLLSGGSTMFPGFSSRLENDLTSLYLDRVLQGRQEGLARLKLRVEDPPTRKHMVYVGASILADIMASYPDFWVSRAEYSEDPTRALSKCSGLHRALG